MNFKETKDFLLNLYNDKSESRDVDDGVRRKQVFYTSIGLMLEAASKYMKTLDPAIFVGMYSLLWCLLNCYTVAAVSKELIESFVQSKQLSNKEPTIVLVVVMITLYSSLLIFRFYKLHS